MYVQLCILHKFDKYDITPFVKQYYHSMKFTHVDKVLDYTCRASAKKMILLCTWKTKNNHQQPTNQKKQPINQNPAKPNQSKNRANNYYEGAACKHCYMKSKLHLPCLQVRHAQERKKKAQ